jgi:hypothetical protein
VKVSASSQILGSHTFVFIHLFITMAKKKTKYSTIKWGEAVIDAPSEGETTMCLGQPADHNVHAEEEIVVADGPPTTPGTSAYNEAAADLTANSDLKPNESKPS